VDDHDRVLATLQQPRLERPCLEPIGVLAEVAETPEEIDYQRAQEAKSRAEMQLASSAQGSISAHDAELDIEAIKEKLQKAITRMELARK